MARKGRLQSASGIYHVLLRGVNRLFSDKADYDEFTGLLKRYSEPENINLFAFLLLENRIHLVISADCDIGKVLKPLCTSYARYFNRTHGNSGRLFYDRFKSEPVDSDADLAGVVSFVNSISQSSGEGYPYCSLSADGAKICSGGGRLTSAQLADTTLSGVFLEDYDCLSQAEINRYIYDLCGYMPSEFKTLPKAELDAAVEKLTKKRWIAKTKLYTILGIKKALSPKASPTVSAPTEKNTVKEEPETSRGLSVWLL